MLLVLNYGESVPNSPITQRLSSLGQMKKLELWNLWRELFEKEPLPEIRRDLMIRIIAHRLQEQELGGLSDASCRRLRQLASTFEADPRAVVSTRPPIKPGTRLLREWKEQVHVVEVETEDYEYKGVRYKSLSEIARLITGTRWSGPVFFGIKAKQSSSSKPSQEVQ